MIAKQPIALQLRYLQTINEISGDRNTVTIFPMPIDFLTPFFKKPTA
jgi:hypothetical protein